MGARDYLQALDVVGRVRDELRARGVTVGVKTNYGPELTVYRAADEGGAGDAGGEPSLLARLFGFKAAVVVRDEQGRALAVFGEDPPPATEPARVAAVLVLAGVLAFIFLRGVK